jgi:hypothetical protein
MKPGFRRPCRGGSQTLGPPGVFARLALWFCRSSLSNELHAVAVFWAFTGCDQAPRWKQQPKAFGSPGGSLLSRGDRPYPGSPRAMLQDCRHPCQGRNGSGFLALLINQGARFTGGRGAVEGTQALRPRVASDRAANVAAGCGRSILDQLRVPDGRGLAQDSIFQFGHSPISS